jgi:two-component system chemotaxis response regulator CheB
VLSRLKEGRIERFRCHTGHAFSTGSLLESTSEDVEARLWDAVRALDETVILLNSMGQQFAQTGNILAAEQCFDQAREAHERSQPIREAASRTEPLDADSLHGEAEEKRPKARAR